MPESEALLRVKWETYAAVVLSPEISGAKLSHEFSLRESGLQPPVEYNPVEITFDSEKEMQMYTGIWKDIENLPDHPTETGVIPGETAEHTLGVIRLFDIFGEVMGASSKARNTYKKIALAHDYGKIDPEIAKCLPLGRLSDEEYAIVSKHVITGYHLLAKKGLPRHILLGTLLHHCTNDFLQELTKKELLSEQEMLWVSALKIADSTEAAQSSRRERYKTSIKDTKLLEDILSKMHLENKDGEIEYNPALSKPFEDMFELAITRGELKGEAEKSQWIEENSPF